MPRLGQAHGGRQGTHHEEPRVNLGRRHQQNGGLAGGLVVSWCGQACIDPKGAKASRSGHQKFHCSFFPSLGFLNKS